MRLGRRRLPDDLAPAAEAFDDVLTVLEPAKAGLTEVLPGTRMPGRPLADALDGFEAGLTHASDRMAAWRVPAIEDAWIACRTGLDEAIGRARRVRVEAPELAGFEGLRGLVSSLLDPLEPFAEAERRFRELRRRGG
jgi:hypothetical protein